MVVDYEFLGRNKLIKGFTYPIKRTDLDAALEKAGVTEVDHVRYTCCEGKGKTELILSATMTGEAFHAGSWRKMMPSIGVFAVPVDISPQVKNALKEGKTLLRLATWLKELELAQSVRRDQRQFFYASFNNKKIDIEHT